MSIKRKMTDILESVRTDCLSPEDAVIEIMDLIPSKTVCDSISETQYGIMIKTNIVDTSKLTWIIQPSNGDLLQIDGVCERPSQLEMQKIIRIWT